MTSFTLTTISEIRKIIRKSASKSCSSDPVPTWLLKEHLDVLLPVITDIVNMSLESVFFRMRWNMQWLNPCLKSWVWIAIYWKISVLYPTWHTYQKLLNELWHHAYLPKWMRTISQSPCNLPIGRGIVLRQHYCMCIITAWGLWMNRRL